MAHFATSKTLYIKGFVKITRTSCVDHSRDGKPVWIGYCDRRKIIFIYTPQNRLRKILLVERSHKLSERIVLPGQNRLMSDRLL